MDIATEKIEIGEDGMPSDPALRSLAVQIRYHLSGTRHRRWYGLKPSSFVRSVFKPRQVKTAMAIWNALEEAGSIARDDFTFAFVVKGRLKPVDAEAKRKNYQAMVDGVAARLCVSVDARVRMAELFSRIRTIYGVHVARFGRGNAVVVPSSITVTPEGPFMASAFAVMVSPEGLLARDVPREAISQSFDGGTYRLALDEKLCSTNEDLQAKLDECYISPFTTRPSALPSAAAKLTRAAILSVGRQKAECAAFVGEAMSGKGWLSFMGSLRRTQPLGHAFSRVLFRTLDPEVRRAAMRNPVSTAASYSWLCGGPRRIQASAVYPVLTPLLPAVEAEIDRGDSLNEALSRVTGLPVPVLRRLAGMTWQKLGRVYGALSEGSRGCDLFEMLACLPPERVPMTRRDWQAAIAVSGRLAGVFGVPPPAGIVAAAAKDWGAFVALGDSGLFQAFDDAAFAVQTAVDGEWRSGEARSRLMTCPAARAIGKAIAGDGAGLGRLRRFNADWHRGEARRTAAMKVVKRRVFGERLVSWKPLWPQGSFECQAGTLEFLCDEDRLAKEGAELCHCVGSYWRHCLSGGSHIASVRGADGGRSTVEISFCEEGLAVVQHRAARNGDPTQACERAVQSFLMAAKGKVRLEDFRQGRDEVKELRESGFLAAVGETDANEILRMYDDCLPAPCRGLEVGEWAGRMRDAGPWRHSQREIFDL